MMPFDSYPAGGLQLLGRVEGVGRGTRRTSGPKFIQKTRQISCAYCGLNLVESFTNWLQMALDHVVPKSVCKGFSLPEEWIEDYTNRVLACGACNGFDNQYKPPCDTECPRSLEEFYKLRDRIFCDRKSRITERRNSEENDFKQQPWEAR